MLSEHIQEQSYSLTKNLNLYNFSAMRLYDVQTGNNKRTAPSWCAVKGPQQPNDYDCGYYVTRNMKELIRDPTILNKNDFNGKRTYTDNEINEVRVEWIDFVNGKLY